MEPHKEAEENIERVKQKMPRPIVDQYSDKEIIKEGELVDFEVIVENKTKQTFRDIVILDKDAKNAENVKVLAPGEIKVCNLKMIGDEVGPMYSPYKKGAWKNESGDFFDVKIDD